MRNRSAFNEGAIYLNAKRFPQAITAFERYLKWEPNDVEAKRGLAGRLPRCGSGREGAGAGAAAGRLGRPGRGRRRGGRRGRAGPDERRA